MKNFEILDLPNLILDHSNDGISLPVEQLIELSASHYKINLKMISEKLIPPALLDVQTASKWQIISNTLSHLENKMNYKVKDLSALLGFESFEQYSVFRQIERIMVGHRQGAVAVPQEYTAKWEIDNFGEISFPITEYLIGIKVPLLHTQLNIYKPKQTD